jgi:RNA-directed DNA polymerase
MRERVKAATCKQQWTAVEYCRFADDLVVLVDAHPRQHWLRRAVEKRLREACAKLQGEVKEEKSHRVDLKHGESVGFLGCTFRRIRSRAGKWMPLRTPQTKKRTALLRQLTMIFRGHRSRPLQGFIDELNPILRGWVNSCACGHASRCFAYMRRWVEKKRRRHVATARKRQGFGWKRWRSQWLYEAIGLFDGYRVTSQPSAKAAPAREVS